MTTDLTGALDVALEQLHGGERIPTILARHPAQAEALAPLLNAATALNAIRPVEMPSPEALSADRNDFLAEIAHLRIQPVSPGPLARLKEWIAHQIPQNPLQRKEQRRMSALLVKATLIISMAFGSAGGAAALAANSLPDSPLYPAKLAMEQTRLKATTDPAGQAALHMIMAGIRVQEMNRQALAGDVPDQATLLRLQTHLNQALQAAAQLPDDDLLGFLTQARQTIQNQEQTLKQVQARAAEPAQEPLGQASRLLSRARQDVEAGLQDPNTIRRRTTEGRPGEAPPQPAVVPVPGGNPDCPTGDCVPVGDEHHNGPQPDQPGPGTPGGNPDCPTDDCEPVGDQHQYGPQPGQPGPGQPGGNPDCPTGDCEPEGDQNQYGPQPEQPGPGEPGGNPDCPTGDCVPDGDQNQNGPQQPAEDDDEPSDPSPSDDPGDDGGGHGQEDGGSDDSSSDGSDSGGSDSGGSDSGGSDSGGGNDKGKKH
jgi:uncharacterized membrane protein YgcG